MKRNYFKCFAFTVLDYYTIPLHHQGLLDTSFFFLWKFRFRKDIFISIAVLKYRIQGYFRHVYFSLFKIKMFMAYHKELECQNTTYI